MKQVWQAKDGKTYETEKRVSRLWEKIAAIQEIAESFKIISNNLVDKENREELKGIKAALGKLEHTNTYDIWVETSEEN